jgi:hypothetical protein
MKLQRRTWSDLSMHRTTNSSTPSAYGNMVTVLFRDRTAGGGTWYLTVGSPLMETDGVRGRLSLAHAPTWAGASLMPPIAGACELTCAVAFTIEKPQVHTPE